MFRMTLMALSLFISFILVTAMLLTSCAKNGDTGPAGPTGLTGPSGSNGTDGMTISSIRYCNQTTGGATFQQNVVTYTTGDKLVYCEISNSLNTYSASIVYRPTQNGSATEGCVLIYDIDAASAGYWYFSLNGSTRTAVYNDSTSASNGNTITYATSDCMTSP